jgi:hypothetical protein
MVKRHDGKGANRPGAGSDRMGATPALRFIYRKRILNAIRPSPSRSWSEYEELAWRPITKARERKELRKARRDKENAEITARIDAEATPILELKARLRRKPQS